MSEREKANKMRKKKVVLKHREALSRNKNHTKQGKKIVFDEKRQKKAEESLMLRTTRVRALIARFWR